MDTAPAVVKVNADGSIVTKGLQHASSIFVKKPKTTMRDGVEAGAGASSNDGKGGEGGNGGGGGALPSVEVVIGRGDALYIPAFWFHEVSSLPPLAAATAAADCRVAEETDHIGADHPLAHVAVNFWFVPDSE